MHVQYIERQGHYILDQLASPIVEIAHAFGADEPSAGRLYFRPQTLVDREWVQFDPAFVAWADRLLSWARRRFTYDRERGLYEGPDALAWRRSLAREG